MTATHSHSQAALVELRALDLDTPAGRPLIRGLDAVISPGDRVALIGRNGAGKSSLLGLVAGRREDPSGALTTRGSSRLVGQDPSLDEGQTRGRALVERGRRDPRLEAEIAAARERAGLPPLAELLTRRALSRGELRKLLLLAAFIDEPELLLLDEPTQDLDERGLAWLRSAIASWPNALLVASHSRGLLAQFEHFFVVAESGCRYLPGRFAAVEAKLEREAIEHERRYVEGLARLERDERRNRKISQRRARKKNLGRIHELRRRTSRARLNEKRGQAQQSQARAAAIRRDRIERSRGWTEAMRRALRVELPLDALVAALPPDRGEPLLVAEGLSCAREGRALFDQLELRVGRERVAITGPNGSGKTTLLKILLGELEPDAGQVHAETERIGRIDQGAANWRDDRSTIELLVEPGQRGDPEALTRAAELVVAHRFPLALAERPLAELSPGERVRAALICLFRREPAVELLVLDEPTVSLDFVGLAALSEALRAWPGGLLVASHDAEFLAAVGLDGQVELGRCS